MALWYIDFTFTAHALSLSLSAKVAFTSHNQYSGMKKETF